MALTRTTAPEGVAGVNRLPTAPARIEAECQRSAATHLTALAIQA